MKIIRENSKRIENVEQGVLLVGMTGSGKSTLTHYLAKNSMLKAFKKNGRMIFKIEKDNQNQEI